MFGNDKANSVLAALARSVREEAGWRCDIAMGVPSFSRHCGLYQMALLCKTRAQLFACLILMTWLFLDPLLLSHLWGLK